MEKKDYKIAFRLSPILKGKIIRLAELRGVTESDIIREALNSYLDDAIIKHLQVVTILKLNEKGK